MGLIDIFSTAASVFAISSTLISLVMMFCSMHKVSKKQNLEVKRLTLLLLRLSEESELKEIEKEISRLQKSLEKNKKTKEKLLDSLSSIQKSTSLSHEQRAYAKMMYQELSNK